MKLINFFYCWTGTCSSNILFLLLFYQYVCYKFFADDQQMASPRRSIRWSPTKLSGSISSQVPASPRTCGSSVRSSPTELSRSISSPILVSPRRSVRTSPAKLSSSIGSSSQVPASSKTCGSIALRSPTELSRNPSPPVTANTGIHPDMARRVGTTAGLLRGTTGGDAISQNEASMFFWNNHYFISINMYILTVAFLQLYLSFSRIGIAVFIKSYFLSLMSTCN